MAKIDEDGLINLLKGMLGKQIIVKRARSGKRYLSTPPEIDPDRELTPAQAAYNNRFKRQAAYGKAVSDNPELKKTYAAKLDPGCTAYIMAWCDAHYPPVVKSILYDGYHGRDGDILYIHATDDFQVMSVWVSIYDNNNQLIEKGEAIFHNESTWVYRSKTNIKGARIEAKAYDRPLNEGVLSIIIT